MSQALCQNMQENASKRQWHVINAGIFPKPEWSPVAENGFRAFHRANLSSQDMQLNNKHYKLHFPPKKKPQII